MEMAKLKFQEKELVIGFCMWKSAILYNYIWMKTKQNLIPEVWEGNAYFGCMKYIDASCELYTLSHAILKVELLYLAKYTNDGYW